MCVIERFKGRVSPSTGYEVSMFLYRRIDEWVIVLMSGNKEETIRGLGREQARSKWEALKKWWE